MENAAIVAMWAAAIAAVVGPIVSVGMAHWMVKQENKRQEASALFRRIMEDSQNYKHAFEDRYQYGESSKRYRKQLERQTTGLSGIMRQHNERQGQYDSTLERLYMELQPLEDRYVRAFQEMRAIERLLNANVYSLGLLFGNESKRCGSAIRDLISMGIVFNEPELPPFEDCQNELNKRIDTTCQAMKPLYESLRNSDPEI